QPGHHPATQTYGQAQPATVSLPTHQHYGTPTNPHPTRLTAESNRCRRCPPSGSRPASPLPSPRPPGATYATNQAAGQHEADTQPAQPEPGHATQTDAQSTSVRPYVPTPPCQACTE